MPEQTALTVEVHDAAQGQSIFAFVQRTDAVGEGPGEHGNHPIREIHGGAAVQGFLVQKRVLLNIFRNIGDVDIKPILLFLFIIFQGNGIVQILGILTIDGDGGEISKIVGGTVGYGIFRYGFRNGFGSLHQVPREGFRQSVSPHNGQNVHTGIADMPEDFLDDALRLVMRVAVVHNMGHHLVTVHRPEVPALGNEDVPQKLGIVRDHEAALLGFVVDAHHIGVGVLQHLGNGALGSVVSFVFADNEEANLVTIQSHADFIGGNEDIALPAFDGDEAETAGMGMENTHMGEVFPPSVASVDGYANTSLGNKSVQHLLEGSPLCLGNAHEIRHFLCLHGRIDFIVYQFDDEIAELFLLFLLHCRSCLLLRYQYIKQGRLC